MPHLWTRQNEIVIKEAKNLNPKSTECFELWAMSVENARENN